MLDKQEIWSLAHNSRAEISKFKCLRLSQCTNVVHEDFHRSNSDFVIRCKDSTKLLSIIVDQHLHWHQHIQYAIRKGESLLFAINRLTRLLFGLPAPYVRRLYKAMAIPKMEYALPV